MLRRSAHKPSLQRLHIKPVLATLLRNFELELVVPFPEPDQDRSQMKIQPLKPLPTPPHVQIKTVLATLLRNFELELVDPFPEPDWDSMVVGPKPCRVRYRRRQLLAAQ